MTAIADAAARPGGRWRLVLAVVSVVAGALAIAHGLRLEQSRSLRWQVAAEARDVERMARQLLERPAPFSPGFDKALADITLAARGLAQRVLPAAMHMPDTLLAPAKALEQSASDLAGQRKALADVRQLMELLARLAGPGSEPARFWTALQAEEAPRGTMQRLRGYLAALQGPAGSTAIELRLAGSEVIVMPEAAPRLRAAVSVLDSLIAQGGVLSIEVARLARFGTDEALAVPPSTGWAGGGLAAMVLALGLVLQDGRSMPRRPSPRVADEDPPLAAKDAALPDGRWLQWQSALTEAVDDCARLGRQMQARGEAAARPPGAESEGQRRQLAALGEHLLQAREAALNGGLAALYLDDAGLPPDGFERLDDLLQRISEQLASLSVRLDTAPQDAVPRRELAQWHAELRQLADRLGALRSDLEAGAV